MIEIKVQDDKLKVSGSFDFGYMGVYKDEQISIHDAIEQVRGWDIVEGEDFENDEQLAEFLTDYYNGFEKKIRENIKQVNDNFLAEIITELNDVGAAFWEIDEITIKDKLPEGFEDDPDIVYELADEKILSITDEYYDTPNDGSLEKPDVEAFIREYFPMLDLDKLIAGVVPEFLTFDDGYISFQCSDDYGAEILCGAYDELDENLTFTDWHNF